MNFIMLINIQIMSVVGIFIFISRQIQHLRVWKMEKSIFSSFIVLICAVEISRMTQLS